MGEQTAWASGEEGRVTAGSARVKLLQFLPHFAIGGTERQAVNLTSGLDPGRFEIHFGCHYRAGAHLAEIDARHIPVTEHPITRLCAPETFRQQVRFARYLRQNRIDIVHSYNFYANAFAIPAAWLARTPVTVASIRGLGVFMSPLQRRAQRIICRLANVIVVNAEGVRQWLISEGYQPDKLVVIRNGIDVGRFGLPQTGAGVRQQLGMPENAPLIAMLARLSRVKGFEYFIDAAAAVATTFPDARFLVIGDAKPEGDDIVPNSDYRSELVERIRRLGLEGRVVLTGFRQDVPEVLSEITVSVLPSLSEGLSNVVLESMAAAVPVVATSIGGTPEIIEDGVTGLLVPPRDSAALARAIRRILEDRVLADRLRHAARRRVAERFSVERMVRETERLYMTQLAHARRRSASDVPPEPAAARTPVDASPPPSPP